MRTPRPAKVSEEKKLGRREQSKRERLHKLTFAARELFAELGYDAATLRQIAAKSGLGLGTLFNYINDKRDLIYLIFNEEMDALTLKALSAPKPWQTLSEKILSITELHYRLFAEEPTLSRILLSEILLQTPGLHLERYLSIRARTIKGMEDLVRGAQISGEIHSEESAEIIARSIFFTFASAIRWWLAAPRPEWIAGQREFARILQLQMNGYLQHSGDHKTLVGKPTANGKGSKRRSRTGSETGKPSR